MSGLVGQDDRVSPRLHPCVCVCVLFFLSVFLGTIATHAFTHVGQFLLSFLEVGLNA